MKVHYLKMGLIIIKEIFRYIVRIGKAKNDNIFYDLSLEKIDTEKGIANQST